MFSKYITRLLLIGLIMYPLALTDALEINNDTNEEFKQVVNSYGDVVFMKESLFQKLEDEANTWHWMPWLQTRTQVLGDYVYEVPCIEGSSIESFPDSAFTDDQLRKGAFLMYCLFGIYTFTLLALVCNDYFIPCVENICEDLKIPPNVGAATFMAAATSCPEFFVNVISTFLTESEMGIGTIVGSALFNALGVAAIGSLAAIVPLKIDRRPVTRDCIIYLFNVGVLVGFMWDGEIIWYEAVVLGILYVCYFIVMFNSPRIFLLIDKVKDSCCNKKKMNDVDVVLSETNQKSEHSETSVNNTAFNSGELANGTLSTTMDDLSINEKNCTDEKIYNDDDVVSPPPSVFAFPKNKSVGRKIWWIYTFPLRLVLAITIPSPITCRKIYPLSFIMCIVWIGVNSYFVSWSMTVIGHTFSIPDSIMGMTFLAFGGCLPEACSIFIMSRRGEGSMGISNALGANSLGILFALGVPWLIRTLALLVEGKNPVIKINSRGIDLVIGSLILAVVALWIALYIGKFILRKGLGFALTILYLIFITFAILVEMGIFFDTEGLPLC